MQIAGAALLTRSLRAAALDREIQITPVSAHALRLAVLPLQDGKIIPVPDDGVLVRTAWEKPAGVLRNLTASQSVKCGNLVVQVTPDPLAFAIQTANGETVQRIRIAADTGAVSFSTGDAPLLGLGEGGPQFDRRGSTDQIGRAHV